MTMAAISDLRSVLTSESSPLAQRFRALFSLKHTAATSSDPALYTSAIGAIAAAFVSPSALLKHELAYCLGQTGRLAAVPHLRAVLEDRVEDAMCRHEAAEALGALGAEECLALLRELRDEESEPVVVRETCEIAVARIEWEVGKEKGKEKLKKSDFSSIDPAPPLPQTQEIPSTEDLESTLLNTQLPLFQRYRAMFALRDLSSPPDLPTAVPAIHALARGLKDPSALFRHEVAFVFGQLSHPASIPSLVETLSDLKEESMVRHEAAEALGSLGDEEGVEEILKSFLKDEEQVVRESVVVALDMAEYEKSGQAEYAVIAGGESIQPQISTWIDNLVPVTTSARIKHCGTFIGASQLLVSVWTADLFERKVDGKAVGFEIETTFFLDESMRSKLLSGRNKCTSRADTFPLSAAAAASQDRLYRLGVCIEEVAAVVAEYEGAYGRHDLIFT
ncbi:MAG: deoxyhypusine hydroxylase [Vezdaea aestivalis]|nr:MAG: deoxyhypusine hydroxylase [Vezdaea aestivalis]